MAKSNTETSAKSRSETPPRVAFDLTPAMAEEVDRMLRMSDLGTKPEVFRRAFTLLRIHVDAAAQGRTIYMVDPGNPQEKYIITLPFNVVPEPVNTE